MKPTSTGIAIGLALAVVAFTFIFPRLSPLRMIASGAGNARTNQNQQTLPMNGQLEITDEVMGTGLAAAAGDTVLVKYVGMFPDGKIFDSSAGHHPNGFPVRLGYGEVIKGWDLGLVGMKVGGKRKLVIPPDLAYGSQGAGGGVIPPNATLVFEVELIDVTKAGQ